MNSYYTTLPHLMTLYQKLIAHWSEIFDKRNEISVLDNVNFNRQMFRPVLDTASLLAHLPVEPGYYSPDGSIELHRLIRAFEYRRLLSLGCFEGVASEVTTKAGVGLGHGTSNVVNALIKSLISESRVTRPNIVVALPNYPIYYAQLVEHKIDVRIAMCRQESGFLPTADDILAACDDQTIGVFLTFPNNPAQQSFSTGNGNLSDLVAIVQFCQDRNIDLIVDNVYREMCWNSVHFEADIFKIAGSTKNLYAVYGPSKDTPFLSGFRLGYWMGDRRLMETYRRVISASENCLNSISLLVFAFHLLFSRLELEKCCIPSVADFDAFDSSVLGWSAKISHEDVARVTVDNDWYAQFVRAREEANRIQKESLLAISSYLTSSRVLTPRMSANTGNLLLLGVRDEYFQGSSLALFEILAKRCKVGILPGEVFGVARLERPAAVPFRITTVHAPADQIVAGLQRIERFFLQPQQKRVLSSDHEKEYQRSIF